MQSRHANTSTKIPMVHKRRSKTGRASSSRFLRATVSHGSPAKTAKTLVQHLVSINVQQKPVQRSELSQINLSTDCVCDRGKLLTVAVICNMRHDALPSFRPPEPKEEVFRFDDRPSCADCRHLPTRGIGTKPLHQTAKSGMGVRKMQRIFLNPNRRCAKILNHDARRIFFESSRHIADQWHPELQASIKSP
jgi:hypothetical protein